MFTHIVPSFASLFVSAGHDIPELTRIMLAISDWMVSWHAVGVALVLFVIGVLVWRWFATDRGRYWKDKHLTRLPFIGSIVQFRALSSFFRALSLLLQGGSPIVSSVAIARNAIKNGYIKEQIGSCEVDIQSGRSVTQALKCCSLGVEVFDLLHMVQVGERSGRLAELLERVAVVCEQRATDRLTMVQMLVQPFIMVSLGLLVSLLIFAIYIPIFNLSDVIGIQ